MLLAWAAVLALFGAFAPQVEHALAGAGWQDSTSQSVKARQIVQTEFRGLGASALQVVVVDGRAPIASDPAARAVVARASSLLGADPRVSVVVPPQPGVSLSANGRTAVITAGSNGDPNAMVRAAEALAGPLHHLSRPGISVSLTGDSALWANFNAVNRSAMLRSEMLSWPVTLVILVLAFGSLVAAGLPLMLTLVGLMVAAGALVLATHVAPVSTWALNFALMFALALGIDYALFLVVRFRAALKRREVRTGDHAGVVAAVAETLDTAGKAVAFSALTVLASLASILLLPSPAFRGTALGIMLAVAAVLSATLTLLPAVLGRLGTRINAGRLTGRRSKETTRRLDDRLQAWGNLAVAPSTPRRTGRPRLAAPGGAARAWPSNQHAFHHDRPSRRQRPGGLQPDHGRLRPRRPRDPAGTGPGRPSRRCACCPGPPTRPGSCHRRTRQPRWTLDQVVPATGPSTAATGATIDRLRQVLPPAASWAVPPPRTTTSSAPSRRQDIPRLLGAGCGRLPPVTRRARRSTRSRRRGSHHRPVAGRCLRDSPADLPRRPPFRPPPLHAPGIR